MSNDLGNGETALANHQPARARQVFLHAYNISRKNPDVLMSIAYTYYKNGYKGDAQHWLDLIAPPLLKGNQSLKLATLYAEMKNLSRACPEFLHAIKMEPLNGSAFNGYAYSCLVEPKKDLDRAIPLLNRAIAITGRRSDIVDSLGWAYFQRYLKVKDAKDLKSAVELLVEAVEKDPRRSEERLHLGLAYEAAKEWDAAYVEMNKAVALDPELTAAQTALDRVSNARSALRKQRAGKG